MTSEQNEINEININTPYLFFNGKTAKNRLIVPAMASQTANIDGIATQKTIANYSRLASSNAGIVFVEYTYVNSNGRSEANQLGLISNIHAQAIIKIAETIHSQGALAGFQLMHGGAKSNSQLTNTMLQSPSGIPIVGQDVAFETPDIMTIADIEQWKKDFVNAAIYASKAGFDIIELHAAHGYGLNQWISPITNKRQDIYGGTAKNRWRILLEITSQIKDKLPDIILSVRIPGKDFVEGGLEITETQELAKHLVNAGASLINVSSGLGGWRNPTTRINEGYLVQEAALIQKEIAAPVIGVGGIKTKQYINQALQEKLLSFAAVGRAILHDKWNWE